jgi:ubiquinol-cytochrome c reductase cytochrome c1 subunit
MKVSLDPKQAKDWFGAAPPDLSVIARSRADIGKGSGADYLYTYLRTYYRDDTKATGWNNLAFPTWRCPTCCGSCKASARQVRRREGPPRPEQDRARVRRASSRSRRASSTSSAYDEAVGDLVAYLQWMGEPAQGQRTQLGVWVLIFLAC